jgi:hypothetical protein
MKFFMYASKTEKIKTVEETYFNLWKIIEWIISYFSYKTNEAPGMFFLLYLVPHFADKYFDGYKILHLKQMAQSAQRF